MAIMIVLRAKGTYTLNKEIIIIIFMLVRLANFFTDLFRHY